jgi:fumarate hydratase class I
MGMEFLASSLLELITQTSTNLPPDVRAAMALGAARETPHTQSSQALHVMLSNVDMATEDEAPVCQDTGMPTFVIHTPVGVNQLVIGRAIREAVAEATRRGKLRPNSVDSITGKNSGNNLGVETPVLHFEQWEEDEIEIRLLLKGGGCENMNSQYSVPCELDHLGRADRNLEGVTAPTATTWPSRSFSAPSTTPTPTPCWRSSKPRSWRRPTGWGWGPWASAGGCR